MDERHHYLLKNAKALRKNMTEHERILWFKFLRKYPIRFYRQRLVGNYILDFYCHRARLAIEIDGSQHYDNENELHDRKRTLYLNSLGIQVIRYTNRDISTRFHEVIDDIDRNVQIILGFNPWESR